jgi:hypothetical protein
MRTGVVAAAAVLLSLAGCGSSASSSSVAPRTASDALTAAHAGDLIDYIDTLFAASSSEPQPPTTGR